MNLDHQVRSATMEVIAQIRHIAGDDERDFNRWLLETDSPRVRECLVAFELADIQTRERGD